MARAVAPTSPPPAAALAPLRAPQAAAATSRAGKKARERTFLIPGETAWEVWAGSDPASAHLVTTIPALSEATAHNATALGLPAREVITLPLWLATGDRSLLPGMVALQCEKRGLLSHSRAETDLDFELVTPQSNESLVRVQLLAPTLSPEFNTVPVGRFDLACRFFSLPDQGVLIWRELGQLCLALTRNRTLVYVTTLGEEQLTDTAVSQIFRLLSLAQAERWLPGPTPVILRGTFSSTEEKTLADTLALPVRREARPTPWFAAGSDKLVPPPVRDLLRQRRKQTALRQRLGLLAILYLIAVAVWGGYVGWLSFQARQLATQVNATAPQVRLLRDTALRWSQLQPAINPTYYPVETLFRCANVLPKEGVQVILFEQRGDKLILTGESKGSDSLRAANTLLSDLKGSKELTEFTWNMPQPSIRENATKFQIEGTRAPAHP